MAKKLQKLLKSFTLIELIIVIAVIAVLGASAFLVLSQWMSKSRDSRKIADLGTIDTAINISITSNDKLPKPDDKTDILFSGNIVWEVGYFGDEAVKQIGGSLTKTPIDPTTKERYRYGVWNNKYQLGTIIENEQFSKFANRVYANEYFTKVQGNYNQTIIVASIDGVDTILPVPSLIVDEYSGVAKTLDEEHFWTNKGPYSLGTQQKTSMKVKSLYSGDLSKLSDSSSPEFGEFIINFEMIYTGTNFVNVLNNKSQDEIKVAIAQELSKVSSQPVSVLFLGCEGYNHGAKVNFYKQELVGYGESCDSIKSQFECNNGNWIGENKAEYTKASCNAQLPAQCDGNDHGTVKDFYSASSVAYGQSCTPNLKSFTCENGTWKDGGSNADTSTYQYTSCIVGNPVDCTATNITKKSVTNLDIIFDVPATLHGQSFEKAKTITESNGSYEYSLVGDCSNGTYQEVNLSEPILRTCNSGYIMSNGICVFDASWSGNSTSGFIYSESGVAKFPKSCNDLLLSTSPNFKIGNTTPYNGTKFLDGVYWIKPNSDPEFKVYCDMTTDSGGWTVVVSTAVNQANFDSVDYHWDITKSWNWKRTWVNKLTFTNAAIKYQEGNFQKLNYNTTYQSYYNGTYAVQLTTDNCYARTKNRCGGTSSIISWGYFCWSGDPFISTSAGASNSAFPGNYPYSNSDNLGTKKCVSSNRQTAGTEFGTVVMLR